MCSHSQSKRGISGFINDFNQMIWRSFLLFLLSEHNIPDSVGFLGCFAIFTFVLPGCSCVFHFAISFCLLFPFFVSFASQSMRSHSIEIENIESGVNILKFLTLFISFYRLADFFVSYTLLIFKRNAVFISFISLAV